MQKSRAVGNPGEWQAFSDIFALLDLSVVGGTLRQRWVVRMAVGGFALFLSLFASRRCSHGRGAVIFLVYMSCYILLFNPQAENNTFVVVATPFALLGAWLILVERASAALFRFPLLVTGMTAGYELSRSDSLRLSPYCCLAFSINCASMVMARTGFGSRRSLTANPGH